jgi:hypothetical protein
LRFGKGETKEADSNRMRWREKNKSSSFPKVRTKSFQKFIM